jgi:hypothetical protein
VAEVRRAAGDQIGEELPDRVGRRRAPGEEVVDLHDVVQRVDLLERQRQLGVVGDEAALDAPAGQVDRLQAVADVEVVALRRQPAVDRARADRDQDLAVARNSRSLCTFSALHSPPSMSPRSHGPQCLMSVSGEASSSISSSSGTSRSSMSSSDM